MEKKKKKSQNKDGLEMKRLIAEMPLEIYNQAKIFAVMRNIPLKQYVIEALIEKVNHDNEYQ